MFSYPRVLWFTGLPCAGKTTISKGVGKALQSVKQPVVLLDGDDLRSGICRDLGFSEKDRFENIRRAAEIARLVNEQGYFICCSFVTPLLQMRLQAREIIGQEKFTEIFVDTPVEQCESRDTKGMYARARKGELPRFTGVSDPYEIPVEPELIIKAGILTIEECVESILVYLTKYTGS